MTHEPPRARLCTRRPVHDKAFLWLLAVGLMGFVAVLGCDLGHNPILPAAGEDTDGGFVGGGDDGAIDGGDSGAPPIGAGGHGACAGTLGLAGHGGAAGSAGSASITRCPVVR